MLESSKESKPGVVGKGHHRFIRHETKYKSSDFYKLQEETKVSNATQVMSLYLHPTTNRSYRIQQPKSLTFTTPGTLSGQMSVF